MAEEKILSEETKAEIKEKLIELDVATMACRDCGKEIWFLKNRIGKFVPMEINFEIHRCPNKPKREFKPGNNNDRGRGKNNKGGKDREFNW